MKALRKLHPGQNGVQLCEVPKPVPAQDEICVKIAFAGICGTDLHIIADEYDAAYPVTLGHEYSGVVDSVGAEVTNFGLGDRVVSLTAGHICGKCDYCHQGLIMHCAERKSIGSGMDGTMAEYMIIKADRVFHLADSVPLREAALCEPIACCVRSVVEVSGVHAGNFVYVSGPGTIGQLVAQILRISGAHVTVAGTTLDTERLSLAKKLGAHEIIDVQTEDIMARARQITGGRFFDRVFECAGAKVSADICTEVLVKNGLFVQVGLYGNPVPINMDKLLIKECHIVNSFATIRSSWLTTLRLMERRMLTLGPLISKVSSLNEWEDAVRYAVNKEGFKVLLQPADI